MARDLLYNRKRMAGMQQALSGLGSPERGFQGPIADAQRLRSKIESFQQMQNWRSRKGHRLSASQEQRIAEEAQELGAEYDAMGGQQVEAQQGVAASQPLMVQAPVAQPAINTNKQPDVMEAKPVMATDSDDLYRSLGLETPFAVGLMDGGLVRGPTGDDQVPGMMPDGSPARLQHGEYVLPAKVVSSVGGSAALDRLVQNITGNQPGPSKKLPLRGQAAMKPVKSYQRGGSVEERRRRFPKTLGVLSGAAEDVRESLEAGRTAEAVGRFARGALAAPVGFVTDVQEAGREALTPVYRAGRALATGHSGEVKTPTTVPEAPVPVAAPERAAPVQTPTRTVVPVEPAQGSPRFVPPHGISMGVGEFGEPEFSGGRRLRTAPTSPYGPTDHQRRMAGIEAQAALAATRRLAAMDPSERGRLTSDQIVGTQHRDALQAATQRGQRLDLAADRAGRKDLRDQQEFALDVQREAREARGDYAAQSGDAVMAVGQSLAPGLQPIAENVIGIGGLNPGVQSPYQMEQVSNNLLEDMAGSNDPQYIAAAEILMGVDSDRVQLAKQRLIDAGDPEGAATLESLLEDAVLLGLSDDEEAERLEAAQSLFLRLLSRYQ